MQSNHTLDDLDVPPDELSGRWSWSYLFSSSLFSYFLLVVDAADDDDDDDNNDDDDERVI